MNTIDYYNQHAVDFYENTVNVDMSAQYEEFLEHVKDNGHILDAGCGSGRDSLYFLDQGYQVTAIDASKELVKLSSELIGQEVLQMKFQDMEFKEKFAGIWACASLLHVSREEIEEVFRKLTRALVTDGVIYMSFKYGDREVYRNGRLFNYYDEDSFRKLKNDFAELEVVKMWKTADVKKEIKDEYWLNVLLQKTL
ncbi:class I SAM-dependent methyltransferase [Halanaerobaculum tunisiense]